LRKTKLFVVSRSFVNTSWSNWKLFVLQSVWNSCRCSLSWCLSFCRVEGQCGY